MCIYRYISEKNYCHFRGSGLEALLRDFSHPFYVSLAYRSEHMGMSGRIELRCRDLKDK